MCEVEKRRLVKGGVASRLGTMIRHAKTMPTSSFRDRCQPEAIRRVASKTEYIDRKLRGCSEGDAIVNVGPEIEYLEC